jgi:hypothetical protein
MWSVLAFACKLMRAIDAGETTTTFTVTITITITTTAINNHHRRHQQSPPPPSISSSPTLPLLPPPSLCTRGRGCIAGAPLSRSKQAQVEPKIPYQTSHDNFRFEPLTCSFAMKMK